jgi:hypothetical protein
MNPFRPDMPADGLGVALAERFAGAALDRMQSAIAPRPDRPPRRADDAPSPSPSPSQLVSCGGPDRHACAHAPWMLARLLRRFPDMAPAPRIRALLDEGPGLERLAGECAGPESHGRAGFETLHGWAWLLALSAELRRHADAPHRAEALAPLAGRIVRGLHEVLPRMARPVRAGTHANTAFALALARDHAAAEDDAALHALLRRTALRWYGDDADCPAWGEPDGDAFLSPALAEAECMRRLLPRPDFLRWLDRFLPRWGAGEPAALFAPAPVVDRGDQRISPLDVLQLSRAWCWQGIAQALGSGDPRRPRIAATVAAHLRAGLSAASGDGPDAHALAGFAVLALDGG